MALAWEHGVRCSPALCSVQSVSAGAAYKSLVLAAAWVMCSYRGHCTVCSLLQHQSSLLSLKNVWTSECSQVLQSVSQPALQQMQPLQASPGWLHRLLQCCSAADQTSGAGLSVWAVRVHLSDGAGDTVWLWSLPGSVSCNTCSEQWSRIEKCH